VGQIFLALKLQEFTEKEIYKFITNLYHEKAVKIWDTIKSIYNLQDLSKRPMLLVLILKTLQSLAIRKDELNRSDVYNAYTEFWIRREAERIETDINVKIKESFMEDISLEMWRRNVVAIHNEELQSKMRLKYAGEIRSNVDIHIIDYDTRNASFLNRDQAGYYKFMHKSFQEFFLGKKCVKALRIDGKGMNCWKYKWFDKEGYQLKAGHFSPFWPYGNSTIKQNLRSC